MNSESPAPEVQEYVRQMADIAGLDQTRVLRIANCESGFNTKAVGDHGTSVGLFQIHLPAHADISKQKAQSLVYSTVWALEHMNDNQWNMWSCDKIV